ncbi:MAG: bifunctional nuclease family protein [Bacteroidales bacterium]|nr:bifunctional nuclease family protein [Bacteroidales bacterium]
MKKLKMEIVAMSYSQSQSGAYALILGVEGMSRRLPIIIGGYEAQAIAIELEKMKPARPLTHDLFKKFAHQYGINIVEVLINKFEEGIFFSKLVCEKDGKITEIDSRTSDAVALALRFGCPIYALESIIDEAGITMDENMEEEALHGIQEEEDDPLSEEDISAYEDYLLDELEEMLKKAIQEENYEEASRLRDEIKKRKKK